MTEAEGVRAAKVLNRAKKLFNNENGDGWPGPADLGRGDQDMRVQAEYLQKAEEQLLAEKKIESVDQS